MPTGANTSLSSAGATDVASVALSNASTAGGGVSFALAWTLADGVRVTQQVALTAGPGGGAPSITMSAAVSLPKPALLARLGLQLPAFLTDGTANVTFALASNAQNATLMGPLGWGTATYTVRGSTAGATLRLDPTPHVTRNGLMAQVWAEVPPTEAAIMVILTVKSG